MKHRKAILKITVAEIKKFKQQQDSKISPLIGGLSNSNYRLKLGDKTFKVQVSDKNQFLKALYKNDFLKISAYTASANIGAKIIAFNLKKGMLISEFIEVRHFSDK